MLELIGPKGIVNFLILQLQRLSTFKSGLVFNYALVFFIGVVVFMVLLLRIRLKVSQFTRDSFVIELRVVQKS